MSAMTRILNVRDQSRDVVAPIHIFWPIEEEAAWSCRWEIDWPEGKRSNTAWGCDAIQALILALQMVGSEIHSSDEHKSGKLIWGKEWIGYGFPVPASLRDLLLKDDKNSL